MRNMKYKAIYESIIREEDEVEGMEEMPEMDTEMPSEEPEVETEESFEEQGICIGKIVIMPDGSAKVIPCEPETIDAEEVEENEIDMSDDDEDEELEMIDEPLAEAVKRAKKAKAMKQKITKMKKK